MNRTIEDLPKNVQQLLQLPLTDDYTLEPVDLHSGLAFDIALLFAQAWTNSTTPEELPQVIQKDYAQVIRLLDQWYEAVCKAHGVVKPWIALTDKERAEELSALLGVEVAVDRFAIGYWCHWAHTKHPKNPRYVAHGMEADAYRGWLEAKTDIKARKD